jgi:hypothetical protein
MSETTRDHRQGGHAPLSFGIYGARGEVRDDYGTPQSRLKVTGLLDAGHSDFVTCWSRAIATRATACCRALADRWRAQRGRGPYVQFCKRTDARLISERHPIRLRDSPSAVWAQKDVGVSSLLGHDAVYDGFHLLYGSRG